MKLEQTKIKTLMILYCVVISVIVLSHSFLEGYGFHLDYTISRYLGMTFWSAILFLATSIISSVAILKFILKFKKEHEMNSLWFVFAILMLAGLLGLSFCPIGLFDEVYGEFGIVSLCHRFFSITMFSSSIAFAGLSFLRLKEKSTRINLATFAVYGTIVAVSYVMNIPFLMNYIFIFEGLFLIWIMAILYNLSRIRKK